LNLALIVVQLIGHRQIFPAKDFLKRDTRHRGKTTADAETACGHPPHPLTFMFHRDAALATRLYRSYI